MVLNCSYQPFVEYKVVIDILILVGLAVHAYFAWRTLQDIDHLEGIVGQMLFDLGKQGILKVEVEEDDAGEA